MPRLSTIVFRASESLYLRKVRFSLARFAIAQVGIGPGVVGASVIRLEPDSLGVIRNRLFQIAAIRVGDATVVVRVGVVRLEPNGRVKVGNSLLQLTLLAVGIATGAVGVGKIGLEPDGLGVIRNRRVPVALAFVVNTTVEVRGSVIRLDLSFAGHGWFRRRAAATRRRKWSSSRFRWALRIGSRKTLSPIVGNEEDRVALQTVGSLTGHSRCNAALDPARWTLEGKAKLFGSGYAQGHGPTLHGPTGKVFRKADILMQPLGQPRNDQLLGHSRGGLA